MGALGAEAEAGGIETLWIPDSPMIYRDPYHPRVHCRADPTGRARDACDEPRHPPPGGDGGRDPHHSGALGWPSPARHRRRGLGRAPTRRPACCRRRARERCPHDPRPAARRIRAGRRRRILAALHASDGSALGGTSADVTAQLRDLQTLGMTEIAIRPTCRDDWLPTVRALTASVLPALLGGRRE